MSLSPNTPSLPQQFLTTHGADGLRLLQERYAVGHKRHPRYPHLVQLKYDQLDSPMHEALPQQCRGIILDESKRWSIVARPFDKFWNYEEPGASPDFQWNNCSVLEKLDGSMMILYHYDGQWHVATLGSPDAGGSVGAFGMTFSELFWRVWQEKDFTLPNAINSNRTFMFEMMTPYNRVVVTQETCDLKLIGIRSNWAGSESQVSYWREYNPVREFQLHSLKDILSTFDTMNPLVQEGYVVMDRAFNRLKVKHPGYVALHHLKDSMSPRRVLEIVRSGEAGEVVANFPEWGDAFARVQARYDGLVMHLTTEWRRLKAVADGREGQKAFAAEAIKSPCSGVLFGLRKGYYGTIKEGLVGIHIDRLMGVLGTEAITLVDA